PAREQGRALEFREAGLAGLAVQQAPLAGAVPAADREVAVSALAVVGAVRVLAAEGAEVVHGRSRGGSGACPFTALVVETTPTPFNGSRTPPNAEGAEKRQRVLDKNSLSFLRALCVLCGELSG